MKGCDYMDFLRINNEFQNLQKKLEDCEQYLKSINSLIKKLEKDIIKLEQKNKTENDVIQKSVNNLILEIKKQFKNSLDEIVKSKTKKE